MALSSPALASPPVAAEVGGQFDQWKASRFVKVSAVHKIVQLRQQGMNNQVISRVLVLERLPVQRLLLEPRGDCSLEPAAGQAGAH